MQDMHILVWEWRYPTLVSPYAEPCSLIRTSAGAVWRGNSVEEWTLQIPTG